MECCLAGQSGWAGRSLSLQRSAHPQQCKADTIGYENLLLLYCVSPTPEKALSLRFWAPIIHLCSGILLGCSTQSFPSVCQSYLCISCIFFYHIKLNHPLYYLYPESWLVIWSKDLEQPISGRCYLNYFVECCWYRQANVWMDEKEDAKMLFNLSSFPDNTCPLSFGFLEAQ